MRATDTLGLVTTSSGQANLSVLAQVPGDAPPNGLINAQSTTVNLVNLQINLAGTATDDHGVASVCLLYTSRAAARRP